MIKRSETNGCVEVTGLVAKECVIADRNVPVAACVAIERICAVGRVVEARFVAKERFRADSNVPVAACVVIERICAVSRVADAIHS